MVSLRSLLVVTVVVSVVGRSHAGTELSTVEGDDMKPAAKFALNLDAVGNWLHNNIQEDIQKKLDGSSFADKDLSVSGLTLQLRNAKLESFEEKNLDMKVENEAIRAIESFRAVGIASTNLCLKKGDDCITVLNCKGNPSFILDGELSSLVSVGTKDARPDVQVLDMGVSVKQFEIRNLGGKCHVLEDYFETDEVQDLITSNTPAVLKSVNLAIDAALEATPKVLPVNELMSVDWSIAGDIQVGAGNDGLRVASKAQLLRADGSVVVGGVEPDVPFHDPTDDAPFTLALHESVPCSAFAVYHENGLLKATLKEFEAKGIRLSMEAQSNAAPLISFQNGEITLTAEVLLDVQVNSHEVLPALIARASTQLDAIIDKDEQSAPALFLHLKSVDVSKINLQFDFGKIKPALRLPIKWALQALLRMILPKIDKKMKASPIRLPQIAGMSMTKGEITSSENHLSIVGGFGKIHHE